MNTAFYGSQDTVKMAVWEKTQRNAYSGEKSASGVKRRNFIKFLGGEEWVCRKEAGKDCNTGAVAGTRETYAQGKYFGLKITSSSGRQWLAVGLKWRWRKASAEGPCWRVHPHKSQILLGQGNRKGEKRMSIYIDICTYTYIYIIEVLILFNISDK